MMGIDYHPPDGLMRLELVLQATITGSQDGSVEAHIRANDFRAAGAAETPER